LISVKLGVGLGKYNNYYKRTLFRELILRSVLFLPILILIWYNIVVFMVGITIEYSYKFLQQKSRLHFMEDFPWVIQE